MSFSVEQNTNIVTVRLTELPNAIVIVNDFVNIQTNLKTMRIIKRVVHHLRRIRLLFFFVVFISLTKVLIISNTFGHFFQFIGLKNFIVYSPPSSAVKSRDDPKPGIFVPKSILKINATKAAKATDVDKFLTWNAYVRERGLSQDNKSVLFRINLPFDKNAYDIMSMVGMISSVW